MGESAHLRRRLRRHTQVAASVIPRPSVSAVSIMCTLMMFRRIGSRRITLTGAALPDEGVKLRLTDGVMG